MYLEGAVLYHLSAADVFRFQQNITLREEIPGIVVGQFTADHHPDQIRFFRFLCDNGSDISAVSHDADPVSNREDLGQLMGNIDQADSSVPELTHHLEQALNFSLGQRGGRLVHDHQLHVQRAGLGDLNHLLDADAKLIHRSSRINVQSNHLQPLLRLFTHLSLIDKPAGRTFSSKENVLCHRQERNKRDLLMDKCNTQLLGFVDGIDLDLLAIHFDGTLILLVNAAKAVHQG